MSNTKKKKELSKESKKKEKIAASASPSLFKPPLLLDVQQYCEERNNGVDASSFIDFYTSKNWMIGKNRMKDWKAAVRTWERRQRPLARGMDIGAVNHDASDINKFKNMKTW